MTQRIGQYSRDQSVCLFALTSAVCVGHSKKKSIYYQRPRETLEDDSNSYYVSRQWMHVFETFADPGPVDNRDFLCEHGGTWCNCKLHMAVIFHHIKMSFLRYFYRLYIYLIPEEYIIR